MCSDTGSPGLSSEVPENFSRSVEILKNVFKVSNNTASLLAVDQCTGIFGKGFAISGSPYEVFIESIDGFCKVDFASAL